MTSWLNNNTNTTGFEMRILSLLFLNCLIVIIITCKKKNFISSLLCLKRKPFNQYIVPKNQSLKWFTSVKWLSRVRLFATSWTAERQAFLSITISRSSLRLTSSSRWCHQPSHPGSSPSPPAPNPSQHQSLFQWVNSSHEVAKVLEFQL